MMNASVVLLVSCGKRKSAVSCQAKDMYNSDRFQKLKLFAENFGLQWYILSAKYGLLPPDRVIDPYDMCLSSCTIEYQQKWASNIIAQFSNYHKDTVFVVAANSDYSRYIVPLLTDAGFRVAAPFVDKDEEFVDMYVKQAKHIEDVSRFYDGIFKLAKSTGGIRVFNECNGKMYWPRRGVYFIVDFNESHLVSNGFPRIVRIGTHAVSKDAKSTLWQRLKTHKGTNDGGGNHRGSIFRLHVGNAIIKKESLVCDTWAIGQNTDKDIRERERNIEQLVSAYIGQLGVIVLEVDDLPSATSDRAFIEKNSIALISSINSSFNFSTVDWLGNYSPRDEIIESCLWNINYIDSDYNEAFIKTFERYIEETIESYKYGRNKL